MAIYRNIAEAVVFLLKEIFEEGKYADRAIEKHLKTNPKWGARDRRFIAEATYEIVRWWRLFRFCSHENENTATNYWHVLGTYLWHNRLELPAWAEWEGFGTTFLQLRYGQAMADRKIRESIPDWLDALGETELGTQWETELHALNTQAEVVLRANTLKIQPAALQKELAAQNIATETRDGFPQALFLQKRQNMAGLPAYQNGLFEIQDASSQLIAPFLQVGPGMKVIDACAGAGGKSLHMAALMRNKGKIISMDVESRKLEELKKRSLRAGASLLEIELIDGGATLSKYNQFADRLLLDVPCSGLGVLRRNPGAKWKLQPGFIASIQQTQQNIISTYSQMLKPGGLMVYATCSILPSENNLQVASFLQKEKGRFELVDERKTWPSEGYDGFYMACLRRL